MGRSTPTSKGSVASGPATPAGTRPTAPYETRNLTPEERHRLRMKALEDLAALGGIKSIPDPVAWQREMRKDRPLGGRDE